MKTTIIKKVLTATLAATLAATLTFTTLAISASAVWNTTDSGKQWVETDGTVAKSKWLTMKSGDRYYIKSNGNAATGLLTLTETVNGKKTKSIYYFAKDGKMQTGWQYVNKNYYYFNTKTGKAYTGTKTIGNYKFKFDNKGIWNGKVYNSKGKDVTSNTDIAKITGIKTKTTTTTSKNPETVVIAGQEYKTDIKEILINKEGVTDEDLVNLKYLTKLKALYIVPGATAMGMHAKAYNYSNVRLVETYSGRWDPDKLFYKYAYTATIRDAKASLTNLDFCANMPNLEKVYIAFADKLTDITGLSKLSRLLYVGFTNCTALKDVKALSTENFQKYMPYLDVQFTENVKFAFNDFHFGKRIKVFGASVIVSSNVENGTFSKDTQLLLDGSEDYSDIIPITNTAIKTIQYHNGKLETNTFGV